MKMTKQEQKQVIKTINMLCRYLTEYTPPEVKNSERNKHVAEILIALKKIEKL